MPSGVRNFCGASIRSKTPWKIVVPLAFADLFYALRGQIGAVRESLLADLVLVDPSDSEVSAERRECSACAATPPNANTQVRVIEMPIRDQ
jgi:hypothetical protein